MNYDYNKLYLREWRKTIAKLEKEIKRSEARRGSLNQSLSGTYIPTEILLKEIGA